jgi:hypothetical protein
MKHGYTTIAAASLAAFVIGIGPAAAQTSSPSSGPTLPGGASAPNQGSSNRVGSTELSTTTNEKSSADSKTNYNTNTDQSPKASGTDSQSPSASPSSGSSSTGASSDSSSRGGAIVGNPTGNSTPGMSSNANDNRDNSVNDTTNKDESPAASPRTGDDDKTKQDLNDKSSIDKSTGMGRADQAAGPHGQEGRDNSGERGSRY